MVHEHGETVSRRSGDTIKTWAAIVGPVIGIAFGVGVTKATMDGRVNKNTENIAALSARVAAAEASLQTQNNTYGIALAQLKEQVTSMSSRMVRMEDMVQQTLYRVTRDQGRSAK